MTYYKEYPICCVISWDEPTTWNSHYMNDMRRRRGGIYIYIYIPGLLGLGLLLPFVSFLLSLMIDSSFLRLYYIRAVNKLEFYANQKRILVHYSIVNYIAI